MQGTGQRRSPGQGLRHVEPAHHGCLLPRVPIRYTDRPHMHRPLGAAGKGFGTAQPARTAQKQNRKGEVDTAAWEMPGQGKQCPCGSGRNYEECCRRYHNGELEPTAESLMRARFSAYVKGEVDYVVHTTHPDNMAASGSKHNGEVVATFRQDVVANCKMVRYLRLKVLSSSPGRDEDEAYVTFRTWFRFLNQKGDMQKGSRTDSMQERSRFVRDATCRRWVYISGISDWQPHTSNYE